MPKLHDCSTVDNTTRAQKSVRVPVGENLLFIVSWVGTIPTLQDDLQNNRNGRILNSCLLLISFVFYLPIITPVLEIGLGPPLRTFFPGWRLVPDHGMIIFVECQAERGPNE